MSETIPHPPQQELKAQSNKMEKDIFSEEEEMMEETMKMTPDQRHALFMKTFAAILKGAGLRSPQYYQDKSQCTSFADILPVEKACVKAANLKSGFIEPKDLIERLQKLKSSDNFELRPYNHPFMSLVKSPLCHEYPPDLKEHPPFWVFQKQCELSLLLGDDRSEPFEDWLEEHWEKTELSLNRTALPDLHLLKNIGSSPNGTLYPRYLLRGLHSLRDCVEQKVSKIHMENLEEAEKKREAAVLDWERRHSDVELDHHLTRLFRTWPSDLMDELDEIDRQTAWTGRRIYIDLLVAAETQMQKLIKFWKDCGLVTGQRSPPSPAIRSPDSFPQSPPQISREYGEKQSPSGSLGSPPIQAESSQLQGKVSGPAHKSRKKLKLSEPRNIWDGRLRPRIEPAEASCQTSRTDRHKSVHKSSSKIELSGPRNTWDGRLRSSMKNAKAYGSSDTIITAAKYRQDNSFSALTSQVPYSHLSINMLPITSLLDRLPAVALTEKPVSLQILALHAHD